MTTICNDALFKYKPSSIVSSFHSLLEDLSREVNGQTLDSIPSPTRDLNKLVVAAVQLPTKYDREHDADGSLNELKNFLDRAVNAIVDAVENHGATLVLIQELFLGPYFCQSQEFVFFATAMDLADLDQSSFPCRKLSSNALLAKMQLLAKRLGVVLPISLFERCNNAHYNAVVVIDADGSIIGRYRKTHIPDSTGYQEKYYFTPGDSGFQVFKTRVGNIGVGICWDQWFPETARALALMGADVLLYPTAIGSEPQDPSLDSADHWQRVMQGHAAANMVPVVASNRYGTEILLEEDGTEKQRITFYGRSFITNNTGAIIQEAPSKDEQAILVAEIDVVDNRATRYYWGIFRDRRPELYGVLLTNDGKSKMSGI